MAYKVVLIIRIVPKLSMQPIAEVIDEHAI